MSGISVRQRLTGEITPVSAEHSNTWKRKPIFKPQKAIDLDLETSSRTSDLDGAWWFKISLDQVHCIDKIVWYNDDGTPHRTWTCSHTECPCEGEECSSFPLTVSIEESGSDNILPVLDCKYGDSIKIQGFTNFKMSEIAIQGKQGERIR